MEYVWDLSTNVKSMLSSVKKLKGHERKVHRNPRNTCVMCGMKYTFDGMLHNHIESIQRK